MIVARNVVTVGGATLMSRGLGFLRDVLIAAALGAGTLADAYFVATQVPNLFRRLLAEGALNSAFVPMWLRQRQEQGDRGARGFAQEILGTLTVVLTLLAVVCVLFAAELVQLLAPGFPVGSEPYLLAVYFLRVSVIYLALVGMVAVAAATLNAAGRVGAAASAPLAFNVVMIAGAGAVVVLGLENSPAAGMVLAVSGVAAGFVQLAVVGGALLRLNEPPVVPQLSLSPETRRFFRMLLPGIVATGIPHFTLMAGTIVASSSPSAVSWLTYAYRLYELPLAIAAITIASVLAPAIAAHVHTGDRAATGTAQSHAFQFALAVSLPAAVALVLLAEPIVGGLFERGAFGARDTAAVAAALAAFAIGLPGHALEKVLGAVSFAHEDTRTPMLTAVVGLTVAAIGAVDLFPGYGHAGVAASIASSGWISTFLLTAVLVRRRWLTGDRDLARRAAFIALATVVMGLAIAGLQALLAMAPDSGSSSIRRLLSLAVLVLVGLGIYLAALRVLGVVRIMDVLRAGKPSQ